MLAATPFAVIFVPTFFVVVMSLVKTRPRLLGAELRAFQAEQAAKKAEEEKQATDTQNQGGQENKE